MTRRFSHVASAAMLAVGCGFALTTLVASQTPTKASSVATATPADWTGSPT